MPQQRDPICYKIKDSLRADALFRLVTPKASQPTRQAGVLQPVMYLERLAVMNETSSGGLVDIGFMVGSDVHWYWTLALTTALTWYWAFVQWTLTADYQVVAQFRVPAQNGGNCAGDICHLNVNGYYLEPYTSP